MHVFFADDSTTNGVRKGMGKLIAFGGLLLPEEALVAVNAVVSTELLAVGAPDGTELKWSPPPGNWIREHLYGNKRTDLYVAILKQVREQGGRVIVSIVDTGRTSIQDLEAFEWSVKFTFERISTCLSKEKSRCIVVADRPGGGKKQEDEFLARFLEKIEQGTEYVPMKSECVLLNVLTTPSRLLRQLQVADLVVSVTTAQVAGNIKWANPGFELIRTMFIRNHLGFAGGTGLKLFPDDLWNLYHWVLDESVFTKAATSTGMPLPIPKLPYVDDDGLP